uniref:FBD domain-containing protein n=1 Tax=Leersia perrieri TaxID=77586 RepID=A0A0D9XZW3_9ORYZ
MEYQSDGSAQERLVIDLPCSEMLQTMHLTLGHSFLCLCEMTTSAAATSVDRISNLSDDLLLLILGFLPKAINVVETSILSIQWRHLWTITPTLRFVARVGGAAANEIVAAVNSVLAQRDAIADKADVKDLEISFIFQPDYPRFFFGHSYQAVNITQANIAAWLIFAERRVTKLISLELPILMEYNSDGSVQEHLFIDFPCSERLQTMNLTLGHSILRIPDVSTDAFRSLTNILLSRFSLCDGDDLRLGHLLSSSCCLQLRRLQLKYIVGLTNLRLDAAIQLEELSLYSLCYIKWIHIDAPSLRVLVAQNISLHLADEAARIYAPSLLALTCDHPYIRGGQMVLEDAHIMKLCMFTHGLPGQDKNHAVAWFLQQYAGADHLNVERKMQFDKDIPELPNITDLRITVAMSTKDTHTVAASIAKLIAKCTKIAYLSIDMDKKAGDCFDLDCKCHQPKDWNNNMMSLEHLRIVEIHDFLSFNDQIELVCLLLSDAPALERMTVTLHESYDEVYLNDPCCSGRWTPFAREHRGSKFGVATKYEWTPLKRRCG